MREQVFLGVYSELSGHHAILEEENDSAWLYLHATSRDEKKLGPVQAACLVFNSIDPISAEDVRKYRPGSPPVATAYASKFAVCKNASEITWDLFWSKDATAALLTRDGFPWCVVTAENRKGFSKAVGKKGPWGLPWSEEKLNEFDWV